MADPGSEPRGRRRWRIRDPSPVRISGSAGIRYVAGSRCLRGCMVRSRESSVAGSHPHSCGKVPATCTHLLQESVCASARERTEVAISVADHAAHCLVVRTQYVAVLLRWPMSLKASTNEELQVQLHHIPSVIPPARAVSPFLFPVPIPAPVRSDLGSDPTHSHPRP